MFVSPSILGPGAVLALAIGLLAAGLRGRRQDRHPVCRRCGFDLFGLPPDSNRCSECGADLRRRRATRIGNRRRSTRTVGLAVALLLPTLAWFGTLGWIFGSGAEIVRYKPVWWLTADAHSDDPATRDVAFAELLRRIRAGSIADAPLAKVVDVACRFRETTPSRGTRTGAT
jgi:ribosomal protein L37E